MTSEPLYCYTYSSDASSDTLECGEPPDLTNFASSPVKYIYEVAYQSRYENATEVSVSDYLPSIEESVFGLLKYHLSTDEIQCCYGNNRRKHQRRGLQNATGEFSFALSLYPGHLDNVHPNCESGLDSAGVSLLEEGYKCAPAIGHIDVFRGTDELSEEQTKDDDQIKAAIKDAMEGISDLPEGVSYISFIGVRSSSIEVVIDTVLDTVRSGSNVINITDGSEDLASMGIFMVAAATILCVSLGLAIWWRKKRRATKAPLCNEEQNVPPLDDAFDSNPGHNQVAEEALESPESAENKSQPNDNSCSPESLKIDLTRSLSISPSKTGDEMELELHLPPSNQLHSL